VPANLSSVALAEEEALAKAGISSSLRPLPSYRSAEINMFVLMEGEAQNVSNRKERRGRKEAHSAIGYVLFVLSAVENGSKMKREAMHPQITRIAQMLRTKTPGWLGSGVRSFVS